MREQDFLAALRALTSLEELTIGDTRMHAGITDLSAWPRLRTLSLVGLDLTDPTVATLARRSSLVTIDLSATENQLFSAIGREQALREALGEWAFGHYDFIIIDCPPTLGLLTINSLVAADSVIIPVQTQYYALKGFTALNNVINQIRAKGLNPNLRILGLLPTFYDARTLLGRDMLEELRELGDHHVFETMVKQTVRLGEAPLVGRPVTSYATNSEAARAYRGLAREVIELG